MHSPWLRWPAGRVRLSERVTHVVVLHVFNHQSVLENEDHLAESTRIERPENHIFLGNGRLQIVDAISDVRPMEQSPESHLIRRHLGRVLRPNVFDPLRVSARVGYPHFTEWNPTFSFMRLLGGNADMVKRLFHGSALVVSGVGKSRTDSVMTRGLPVIASCDG